MARKGTLIRNPDGRDWCGPAAMTVLTGLRYKTCEAAIRKAASARGHEWMDTIRGTSDGDVIAGLLIAGLRWTESYKPRGYYKPTPSGWARRWSGEKRLRVREFAQRFRKGWWLVCIGSTAYGDHWIVVKGGRWWCGQTHRHGVLVKSHRRREDWVWNAYRFEGRASEKNVFDPCAVRRAANAGGK